MKKYYLPFVAAVTLFGANVAFAADEPSLTQIWANIYEWPGDAWAGATNPIDWDAANDMMGINTGSRWGVGLGGKIYAVNCRTMSIMAFDADGYKDVYKLPSLKGKTITYNATDEAFSSTTIPDFYGSLITRDDAGHFIVGHGFTTGAMPCTWTIYDPESNQGRTFYKEDFGFDGAPAESFLRIDAVGRALGNVLENGILWVAPTSIYWKYDAKNELRSLPWASDATKVQLTKIIQFVGEGNLESVIVEGVTPATDVSLDAHTSNICQPRYNTIDELMAKYEEDGEGKWMKTITEGYIMYSKKANAALVEDKYALTMGFQPEGQTTLAAPIENLAESDLGNNYAGYTSFDTFTLGGKRYYATYYQTKDESSYSSGMMKIGVFDETGTLVKDWTYPEFVTKAGRGAISTELIADDENSAYIYVYAQSLTVGTAGVDAVGVAQLKFTAADAAGISDVVVDENSDAPAVYYNLQGVKVANPENGIYLVRRGNKVVKELVK